MAAFEKAQYKLQDDVFAKDNHVVQISAEAKQPLTFLERSEQRASQRRVHPMHITCEVKMYETN